MIRTLLLVVSLTSGATASVADVSIETLDGNRFAGRLLALDQSSATLETAQGRKTFSMNDLLEITLHEIAASTGPADIWTQPYGTAVIELNDGSVVVGSRFEVSNTMATLQIFEPDNQPVVLKIPLSQIVAVRLHSATPDQAVEWQRIRNLLAEENISGDLLVVKKTRVLDYHRGVLGNVTANMVDFNLDGDVLPVPRRKIFGLIYHRPPSDDMPSAICRVCCCDGACWLARSIEYDSGMFRIETPGGLHVSLPLSAAERLDFSAGKILYLDDLAPQSVEWTPYFGKADDLPARRQLFGPCVAQDEARQPVRISGREFTRAVSLHSRGKLVYLMPAGFGRFRATAGIADRARPGGHVRLIIRGDDRILLDKPLSGTDPPFDVDVELSGARTLTILVDFGDGLDLGDHLVLGDARLVK